MFTNRKKLKLQGKTKSHRKALIRGQITELVRNQKIKTTPKKSKALKSEFDKLVTKAKKKTEHSKRQIEGYFNHNTRAVERFYSIVESKLGDRNSGYTITAKTLPRKGDNAEQVYVMLVNAEIKVKKSKLKQTLEKQEEKKGKKDNAKKGIIAKDANKMKEQVSNKSQNTKARRIST